MVHQGLLPAARQRFWLVDRPGLLTEFAESVTDAQKPYLRSAEEIKNWSVKNPRHIDLLEVIEQVNPPF